MVYTNHKNSITFGRLPQSEKKEVDKYQVMTHNIKCYIAFIILGSSYMIIYLTFMTIKWNRYKSFYRWEKGGTETVNNLPRVTQLVSRSAEIWTQAASLPWLLTARYFCLDEINNAQELAVCWTRGRVGAQQKCHKGGGCPERWPL